METYAVNADCEKKVLKFCGNEIEVKNTGHKWSANCVPLNAIRFLENVGDSAHVFAALIHNLEKAFGMKTSINPRELLPDYLLPLAEAFEPKNTYTLPPYCSGIDHQMPLEVDENGLQKQVPCGPLYSISWEELLVQRKTLTELLNKNWTRQSKSPFGSPALFTKNHRVLLQFCVDYRGLNAVIQKDRFLFHLIKET